MIERIEVDERDLARLVEALRAESDGKSLTDDLVRELTQVAEPALRAAQGALMGMPSHSDVEPGIRSSVARKTRIQVRLTGKHPGVAIVASKSGMPRSFFNAAKRLNSAKGWRHKVYGKDVWVTQVGAPGWFDDTIPRFEPAAERAAARALDNVAKRIDSKTKG